MCCAWLHHSLCARQQVWRGERIHLFSDVSQRYATPRCCCCFYLTAHAMISQTGVSTSHFIDDWNPPPRCYIIKRNGKKFTRRRRKGTKKNTREERERERMDKSHFISFYGTWNYYVTQSEVLRPNKKSSRSSNEGNHNGEFSYPVFFFSQSTLQNGFALYNSLVKPKIGVTDARSLNYSIWLLFATCIHSRSRFGAF